MGIKKGMREGKLKLTTSVVVYIVYIACTLYVASTFIEHNYWLRRYNTQLLCRTAVVAYNGLIIYYQGIIQQKICSSPQLD